MKTPALGKFRQKLAADEPVYGLWVTLESASITEMAVALGLDWVVIDAEHGHLDWHDILEHVRATVRSETVILVRILELDQGIIKRCLDIGADGVVIPWIESAEQVQQAMAFARYPSQGVRGIGGERATCWGQCLQQHVDEANENVLVIPIIESVEGGRNVDRMLNVPGVEVFFFGPSDYSSSAGFAGQWEGPGIAESILAARDKIRAAGKHCGVIATSNDNLTQRLDQGFRMLALGLDGGLLIRGIRGALSVVGRDRNIVSTLTANDDPPTATAANSSGKTASGNDLPDATEIAPGVSFAQQLGPHDGMPNLTAGVVTFKPGAVLPYHRHLFTECITLLAGRAMMEVEGRMYRLDPLDSVSIPRGLAHSATNRSATEPAVFHIAMATGNPARELVDQFFSRRAMPTDATGQPGAERVTRGTACDNKGQ